jgi:hypothetical protein
MDSDNDPRILTEPKMQLLSGISFVRRIHLLVRFVFKPFKYLAANVFQLFDAFLKLIFADIM